MTGFVYAMTAADGRVKVGWSSDPIRRLTKVGTDCSSPVQLVGLVPATKKQEAELLDLLAPWRAHRDWFRPEGAVLELMRLLPRPMPKAKEVREFGAHLSDVTAIVEALGGPAALARRLKRTPQQVCNWKSEGTFPDWTYPILTADLEEKGHTAPRKLWRRLAKFAS